MTLTFFIFFDSYDDKTLKKGRFITICIPSQVTPK